VTLTGTSTVPSTVAPSVSMVLPSLISCTATVPDSVPAVAVEKLNFADAVFEAPAAISEAVPLTPVRLPLATDRMVASRFSE